MVYPPTSTTLIKRSAAWWWKKIKTMKGKTDHGIEVMTLIYSLSSLEDMSHWRGPLYLSPTVCAASIASSRWKAPICVVKICKYCLQEASLFFIVASLRGNVIESSVLFTWFKGNVIRQVEPFVWVEMFPSSLREFRIQPFPFYF